MDAHVLLGMPANSVKDAITAGYGFVYSTAATGVTGAIAATSSVPMLWNPTGSGRRLRILEIKIGGISGTKLLMPRAYRHRRSVPRRRRDMPNPCNVVGAPPTDGVSVICSEPHVMAQSPWTCTSAIVASCSTAKDPKNR